MLEVTPQLYPSCSGDNFSITTGNSFCPDSLAYWADDIQVQGKCVEGEATTFGDRYRSTESRVFISTDEHTPRLNLPSRDAYHRKERNTVRLPEKGKVSYIYTTDCTLPLV